MTTPEAERARRQAHIDGTCRLHGQTCTYCELVETERVAWALYILRGGQLEGPDRPDADRPDADRPDAEVIPLRPWGRR
ncbi:hypothetical protein [Nocardioides sp.]|uniref:hypothetical protein n=1 Tax=Nocardioides sp. TaxID=35761 RepID=UPI002619FBDA|nr:hypothetical protein [Nocardioides sp.]MDI6908648.1 hypothetical protein [Nocardioides sp.]